jgi:hypothetical protein
LVSDADVGVGQVAAMRRDIVEALIDLDPALHLPPRHLKRLERVPRPILGRQVGSRRALRGTEYPALSPEQMYLHAISSF